MNFLSIAKRLFSRSNQFDEVPKIPLESPLEDALARYGEPFERRPNEDFPEAMAYGFLVTNRVDVLAIEWRGKIHCISFWARKWQDPTQDLEFVLTAYGEGVGWDLLEQGYLYRRKDNRCYLNCSAMPYIGVKTIEYANAVAEYKKAQNANEQSA